MSRDFVAELEALRATFLASLPDRVAHLAGAIAAARHGSSSLSVALGLAHRLRGTAGSYGLLAVAERVGAVEDLLETVEEWRVPPTIWDQLDGLLVAARAVIPT
jgi:hypothetical protein